MFSGSFDPRISTDSATRLEADFAGVYSDFMARSDKSPEGMNEYRSQFDALRARAWKLGVEYAGIFARVSKAWEQRNAEKE